MGCLHSCGHERGNAVSSMQIAGCRECCKICHALFNLLPPPPSLQVLCVFNNSTTARAPLALALSVNDCKGWEPLAVIEEDPKGGCQREGPADCCYIVAAGGEIEWKEGLSWGGMAACDAGGQPVPAVPPTWPSYSHAILPTHLQSHCRLLSRPAGNFSCPSIVEWTDDTVKIVYTVRIVSQGFMWLGVEG